MLYKINLGFLSLPLNGKKLQIIEKDLLKNLHNTVQYRNDGVLARSDLI